MSELSILDCDVFEVANQAIDDSSFTSDLDDFACYRNIKKIGEGGMGEVYLAEDIRTGRRIALKFISSGWNQPHLKRRFHREILNLAQLEHAFIAHLYEPGSHPDGTPYFSMEYVDGTPLDEYCRRANCSLEERIRLFQAVCEAVNYAHSRAVIHLDLKPSNILVSKDGKPKLLDFGIARRLEEIEEPATVTQTQVRLTPAYAAPEQFLRGPLGTFTDVYSLGIILYQLLTGKLPYDFSKFASGEADAWATDERDPEKPSAAARKAGIRYSITSDLDVLCLTALKKDIAKRYRSVVELLQDVDHYVRGKPLKARPNSMGYRLSRFVRRKRRPLIVTAAVALVIASLTGFYLFRLEKARNTVLAQARRTERVQRFMLSMFGGTDAGPPDDLRVLSLLNSGVRDANLLRNEPDVQADLYHTLGSIYHQLGKFDRSESLLRLGLGDRRRAFGPDSKESAESLVELGYLRVDQGKFRDAERFVREALQIYEKKSPADDPARARALTALGSVLFHEGKLNDGVKILEDAVRIQSQPAAEQADLVESLTYLADCQQHLGHSLIARSLAQRILALDRRIYGDRHPHVAEDLSNLGETTAGLGKYREAEQYHREALDIERNWYGQNHLETGLVEIGLGKTLVSEGIYAEGERVLRQALSTVKPTVGEVHPFVGISFQWLGISALKQGKLDEAEADFRRMAEIFKSVFGEDKGHQAMVSLRFGELRFAQARYPEAETLFRQAVSGFAAAFSADNAYTSIARIRLGSAMIREKRWAEAEPELLAGYRIVTSDDNYSPDAAIESRRGLVSVYEALHVPEKAERFRAELAKSDR